MGVTNIVSISTSGTQGNSDSWSPVVSSNGRYVVFASEANNLVIGDGNNSRDIFLHDRFLGITTRVSVNSNNIQANDHSLNPDLSSNGRWITFASDGNNLVAGDSNDVRDIFIRDRRNNTTTRIPLENFITSQSTTYLGSDYPSISDNGRYIALAAQFNNSTDLLLYDRVNQSFERVASSISNPEISGNGNFIVFASDASNLVSGDTNNQTDIFVYDRQNKSISRVSVDSNGVQGNASSLEPAISRNGRFVVFQSFASNLGSGVNGDFPGLFLHDRFSNDTIAIPKPDSGTEGMSYSPSISPNGRYIAFIYNSGETIGLYRYDRLNKQLQELHSTSTIETTITGQNQQDEDDWSDLPIIYPDMFYHPSVSNDGRYVAFESTVSDLVPTDSNNRRDIFIYDLITPAPIRGTSGNDLLYGTNSSDIINGLAGNDRLFGYQGDDKLTGGLGRDKFCFNSPTQGIDRLRDFNPNEDLLEISAHAFNLAKGALAASGLVIGTAATTSDHRFIYDDDTGALLFDQDGNGSIAARQIASLPKSLNLTSAHFLAI